MTDQSDDEETTEPSPEEVGAYPQFKPAELKRSAAWLALTGAVLLLALWITAVQIDLLSTTAEDPLANLVAISLLTIGLVAFLVGVLLQLAALRVAKLPTRARAAGKRGVVDDVSGVVKTIGEALKTVKVPVAAMIVGAALMVMSGFVAMESGRAAGDPVRDEERDRELELLHDRELARIEGAVGELCEALERRDFSLRRFGDLGELIEEICR